MKSLHLNKILKIINGCLIKGNRETLVEDCAHGLWAVEKDNTMYFHFSKSSTANHEAFRKYKNIIIITEVPEHFIEAEGCPLVIKVNNIKDSYWKFVDYYRGLFDIPIIGVTGTCGKSTTTRMINHILSQKYNVVSTPRGNNSINFDFSYLMKINNSTEAAVFEMGVDNPGDLLYSNRHFKPQIRVLLNIGVYHILGCKTLEGYINAKARMFDNLESDKGIVILNGDDENIKKIDFSRFKKVICFGHDDIYDFRAVDIKTKGQAITFTLQHEGRNYEVYLPGLGKHNAYNALAAVAAVTNAGITINEAVKSLKTYEPMTRHLQLRPGPNGCTILDDNWNNTPPSMASALETLKEIAEDKKKIAVFGQMYNLGSSLIANEQYSEMGKKVVQAMVDLLVIIGEKPLEIGKKALALGMKQDRVFFINSGNKVLETISPFIDKDTMILLKACEDNVVL